LHDSNKCRQIKHRRDVEICLNPPLAVRRSRRRRRHRPRRQGTTAAAATAAGTAAGAAAAGVTAAAGECAAPGGWNPAVGGGRRPSWPDSDGGTGVRSGPPAEESGHSSSN